MNDVYISVDVETDGPVPGECSMVQIGAAAVATLSGRKFERIDSPPWFKANLKPLPGAAGDPKTVKWLAERGVPLDGPGSLAPEAAMHGFREWVIDVAARSGKAKPVFVAYPLSFDWQFTHYYFERFLGFRSDPFGFSSALCIKSMYAAKARAPMSQANKGKMPKRLTRSKHRHTHDALDDALGQGDLFCNVWEWDGP